LQALVAKRKWFTLTAVNLGNFVPPFDTGVMALILPTISISLQAPIQLVVWIPLTSLIVTAAFMPLFGKFSDAHGRKRYFVLGLVLFSVGAYLSGQSLTIYELIMYRIVQSLGGAFILANGRALIADAFPLERRGFALGTHVSIIYVGWAVGTAITGSIVSVTHVLGWRYIFDISSTIAAVSIPVSLIAIKESPKHKAIKTDWFGGVTFVASLAAALMVLTAGANGIWAINAYIQYIRVPVFDFYVYLNTAVSVPLEYIAAVGIVAVVLLILRERTADQPLIDFHLFRTNTMFSTTNFACLFLYMSSYSILILLSFFLETIKTVNPFDAGLILAIEPVSVTFFSVIGGWLADRTGSRDPSIAGLGITAVGLLLFSTTTEQSTIATVAFLLAMVGAGVGLFAPGNTNACLASVPPKDRAMANGMLGMMRHAGQSVSLAVGTAFIGIILFGVHGSGTFTPSQYISAIDLNFVFGALLAGIALVFAFKGREPIRGVSEPAEPE